MKPLAKMRRCVLVALTAIGVAASPVAAQVPAACKNDGVRASSQHHPNCCCGADCQCAHCPGADSSEQAPAPEPTIPDDGQRVVKIQVLAQVACTDLMGVFQQVIACRLHFSATVNRSSSLIAMHTCLRV